MNKNECNDTVQYTYVCYTSLIYIYIYSYHITYISGNITPPPCDSAVPPRSRACRVPQHIPQLPDVFMFQLDSLKK